jgi:class 3 adenylate cyclase
MRVLRSFGFIDLCGFTRFTDAQGDEEAVEVLTLFRTAVRQIASDNGVRVAKWLGDGAMFVSTEEQRLVDAVLAISERADEIDVGLPLRAGMAGGNVILFEGDDYIGGAVNLAARLCDSAKPHEVLSSAFLAESFDDSVSLVDVGPRSVPGFVQDIDIVCIERATKGARGRAEDSPVASHS